MLRLGLRAPLVARNYLLLLVLLITETLSDGSIDGIVNVHKSREKRIFSLKCATELDDNTYR